MTNLVAGAALAWVVIAAHPSAAQPRVDHHQHLLEVPGRSPSRVTARDLVALLDEAGIRRAVVLSIAYQYANPNKPKVQDEYSHVKAENDWTSEQVAQYPDRLRAFCSLNPLRDYALEEVARCATDPRLRIGLKLHFGNSDVDLSNADHVARVRAVFRAANDHDMAIVVHLRPSVTRHRPYGARIATAFLTEILPAAPDVAVQIAHLAGAGGYDDPSVDDALGVFVGAIAQHDTRMARVYFDVSGVAGLGRWRERGRGIAARIRQIGPERVLYGSDGATGEFTPRKMWEAFRQLPLSDTEFAIIAGNVAPYLQ